MMEARVIVVGGGVTGLLAARRFRERGVAVTLIDRGFPLGGRLCPTAVDISEYGRAVFDPGPVVVNPLFHPAEASDAPLGFPPVPFCSIASEREAQIRPLQLLHAPVLHVGGGLSQAETGPEFLTTFRGGAQAVVDHLRPRCLDEHLQLLTQTVVTGLEPSGRGWRVHTQHADGFRHAVRGDAVLLTQPVPDALTLLDASAVEVPDAIRDELGTVSYSPGLALFAAFRGLAQLPPGGVVTFAESPIMALSDNASLGASPAGPVLTAILDPSRAVLREGESDAEFSARLLPLLAAWGGESVWCRTRRWSRFRAERRLRMPFVEASDVPPLVLAGDGFANFVANRLDAASTSATHAVAHLCRTLAREARIAARPLRRTPTAAVVEACVTSAEEAHTAVAGGAERLLLCAAPEVGGITPTVDALRLTRRAIAGRRRRVPVTVLVRPRVGGFGYSAAEFEQMACDARRLLRAGADEIAFGILQARGGETRIDVARCRVLVELAHANRRGAVFNRAFDHLPDRRTGLQDLIALEFDRVYSSGGRRLALDGTSDLAASVGYAGWDLEVVAAGGIGPGVVRGIVRESGCRQVLVGLRDRQRDPTADARMGGVEYETTDGARVRATVTALRQFDRDNEMGEDFAQNPAAEFETDLEALRAGLPGSE